MNRLGLDQANTIITGAFNAAEKENGKPLAVVVLDASGHIISAQRQNGTTMFRLDIARGKAWGAAAFEAPSRALATKAKANPVFLNALAATAEGKLLPNPGAVPIFDEKGFCLGAVGISGDSGERDEQFAIAGVVAAGLHDTRS